MYLRNLKPTRYIPQGSEEKSFPDIPAVVYLYSGRNGGPSAVAYGGKRNRPDWHFRFRNAEQRDAQITEWVAGLRASKTFKEEYRKTRKTSEHARGAQNLKADLAKAFPGVSFSVTSKSFSMGDSIHVSWTGGPSAEAVGKIAGKYQHGWFDGMEDLYHYDHSRDYSRGSAKYVHWTRHAG